MNPVLVINSLARAGAERSVANLAVEFVKRGSRPLVISLTGRAPLAQELRAAGVEVAILDHAGPLGNLASVIRTGVRLRRLVQAHRASVVHSQLYTSDVLSRLFTPAGIPRLTTLHTLEPWWHDGDRRHSRRKTAVEKWTGRLAGSHYVAVSEAVRDEAMGALGLVRECVRVIPNGVRLEKFSVQAEGKRDEPIIIQVGSFYRHKGQETSLQAFEQVKSAVPGVRLVFVGGGPLRKQLEKLSVERGLHDRVEFFGETDDVVGALRRAMVFWMPSEREGLPNACLEAMAMELPVVASRVGGLQEVVVDGETGYLVPPGDTDALAARTIEVLLDRERGYAMGKSGRSRVERLFRMEQTAARYLQAYEDLTSGRW